MKVYQPCKNNTQTYLRALGYYQYSTDGIIGPNTISAIKNWQKDYYVTTLDVFNNYQYEKLEKMYFERINKTIEKNYKKMLVKNINKKIIRTLAVQL